MTEVDSEISAAAVEKYLTQHPEFFQGRNDLLANLKVPHASGQAVSLVEKQLGILRERNTELRNRLSQLIESARGNDRLFAHSRKLVLALLDCKSVAVLKRLRSFYLITKPLPTHAQTPLYRQTNI